MLDGLDSGDGLRTRLPTSDEEPRGGIVTDLPWSAALDFSSEAMAEAGLLVVGAEALEFRLVDYYTVSRVRLMESQERAVGLG